MASGSGAAPRRLTTNSRLRMLGRLGFVNTSFNLLVCLNWASVTLRNAWPEGGSTKNYVTNAWQDMCVSLRIGLAQIWIAVAF